MYEKIASAAAAGGEAPACRSVATKNNRFCGVYMCVVVCSAVKISGVRRPCAKLQVKNHVVRECFELSNYVDHNKWCSSRTWEQSRDVSRFRFLDGVR